jgi:hypothetical protein
MTVEVTDVEDLLGRELTTEEGYRVDRLIEMAEAAVESALPGFSIAADSETVDVRSHDGELWTPRYPVTAIASLNLGDAVLSAAGYQFTEFGHVVFGERSILNSFEIEPWRWSSDPGPYTVTYSYGLDPLPADVASAVAGMVAATLRQQATNPDNVASESLGAYAVTYGTTADRSSVNSGLVTNDDLRHQLRRWRRTVMVSAPLVP